MNRRDFLLGSACLTRLAPAQTGGTVRTAMIGVGNRGSYLLKGVLEQSDAKVTALCDNKSDRLDKAATAASRDNPKTLSDWRKVIDLKDVDAVFIATPPYLHSEMAVAALKAGKHVYCEKPIGINPAQVRDVVQAARASKSVFVAGQQLRSLKRLGESIGKIHDGAIGDVLMVKAQRHATADLDHAGSSGDWYFDVTKSGGYLIEQSVHNLDICNWVAGNHPLRASGFGGIQLYKNDPPGRTIFDCGSLTYEYPNGVMLSFTQNVFHPRAMPNGGQYVYVYGGKGAVDLIPAAMFYPLHAGESASELAPKQQEDENAHIEAFYACITKGARNPADIVIGATAALTSILGHQAMTTQKVVNWADLGVDI